MGIRGNARRALSLAVERFGYELVDRHRVYDWQLEQGEPPAPDESTLAGGARTYLLPENPRLQELRATYAAFDPIVTTPLTWTEGIVDAEDLLFFRGENAYIWQLRGRAINVTAYALATYYLESVDRLGLLELLEEDGAFGCVTYTISDRVVSRDLLDSILEIYFLDRHLQITDRDDLTMIDIGAGYGRLAHRMLTAVPNLGGYYCTDAVAESTFISEYYLRHRGLQHRGHVIPLDEVEQTLANSQIDVAVNIHSFSECTIPAIRWWLSLLAESHVKHLMLVPNPIEHGGERLLNMEGHDITEVAEKAGYVLVAREPKYGDPVVQRYALAPTFHYLFELQ